MSVPKVFYRAFRLPMECRASPLGGRARRVTPLLIHAKPRFLLWRCDNLLRRRTKIAIGTERAVILGIRSKLPTRDSVRHLLYPQLCFFQLRVGSCSADSRVVFEAIEDEAVGVFSQRLPRRERIQGELQALVGIL